MSYEAIVKSVEDERGIRAVVIQADPVIWIAPELLEYASDPQRERISGDIEVDGDQITFGTPGEGLGRLTYRLIGRDPVHGVHVAEKVETSAGSNPEETP